jgi:hypothetical protein
MPEIDVECYVWTANGMRIAHDTVDAYVPVREVERLCEEAHRCGFEQGERSGYDKYKSPTGM